MFSQAVHASGTGFRGSPMVPHIDNCQLSSRWHGQERPRALQVAVCSDAIRTLSPSLGFHLIHIRL